MVNHNLEITNLLLIGACEIDGLPGASAGELLVARQDLNMLFVSSRLEVPQIQRTQLHMTEILLTGVLNLNSNKTNLLSVVLMSMKSGSIQW